MAQNDKNVVTEDKVTFRLCDDCLGVNLKTLIPKLKKKAPNAEFIIGCQSYCGPGRTQTFTLVKSRICIADTEVELMPLVDEKLRDRMSAEDEEKYRKRLERRLERTFYFIIPENATIKVGEEVDVDKEGVIARKAGKSYLDDLIIEGEIDNTKPGTYELIYRVNIDNKEHKRKRLITVVDENV